MNTLTPIKPQFCQCSVCDTPTQLIGVCKTTGLSYGKCCSEDMAYATQVIDSYMIGRGVRHPQPGDSFSE